MTSKSVSFGKTKNGLETSLYSISNSAGVEAKFCDYGATWVSMNTPDAKGDFADVLLGFDSIEGYESNPFISCAVGRFANRISKGMFTLDNIQYRLDINEPPNQLHGGTDNLSVKLWDAQTDLTSNQIVFTCTSKDGESGYPGNLDISISYKLTEENELIITYLASTDKLTHINLTNHAYFNLGDSANILNHSLKLAADRFTPVHHSLIPTGEITLVPGSLDFRNSPLLRAKIQMREKLGDEGLDHNLVFETYEGDLRPQGCLIDPKSGRTLTLATTEPAVQIYTGNHLEGMIGKDNRTYTKHAGVCLETQHFPDSPNHQNFPSTLLSPDNTFQSTTVYQFGVTY